MIIDYGSRASGKTTRAIIWLQGGPKRCLLTFNQMRKAELVEQYPEFATQIMTMDEYQKLPSSLFTAGAIDDAEMVLQNMMKHPLGLITMSAPPAAVPDNADRPINFERD